MICAATLMVAITKSLAGQTSVESHTRCPAARGERSVGEGTGAGGSSDSGSGGGCADTLEVTRRDVRTARLKRKLTAASLSEALPWNQLSVPLLPLGGLS